MSTGDTSTSAPGAPTTPDTGLSVRAVATAFATPVLFMLFLAATLVTAFHSPSPQSMALTIAGPASITSPLVAGLEQSAPGSFDLTQTDDAGVARAAVESRESVGAIVISADAADGASSTVTAYVASGGGRAASSTVEGVGAQIAAQLGATVEVVDVAPLVPQDALGSGIFYIVIYSTIGGFLALIVLTQLSAGVTLRRQLGVAAATAVLVPTTVFALSSIFLDGFGLGLDQALAFLAVMAIYVFIVALVVVASHQLLGKASVLAVVPLTVFINFASAGGGVPESMIPAFWQAVHSFWFGSGAIEAGRAIVYFPDADPTRWIMQMLVWVVALLTAILLIDKSRIVHDLQDVVPGTSVPDEPAGRTRSPLVAVVILPLFFIVVFVLAYVSAAHAPVPHNLSLTLAGPSTVTSAVVAQMEDAVPGAFELAVTDDLGSAVERVERRSAVGAVLIETTDTGSTVTAVVASGGGRMAAGPVQQVADQVAEQLGTTALTQDVAPVSTADGAGTGLFYLLVLCTMGAYLSVTAIFQILPGRRARVRVRVALIVSALAPIVAFGALSFSLGALGGSAGQVAALLSTAMVYTLVVSLIAMFFNELVGRASVFAVVIFCLALNLPAAGGSVPASMLPPFWQWVNSVGFGSAAMNTFQSLVYFDGSGWGWPFVRLLIWLAGIGLALMVVCFAKARRAVSDGPVHEHEHSLEEELESLVPARV